MSNITINTEIIKNEKRVDGLAVRFDLAELNKIISSTGIAGANEKLEQFVNRYTTDLKKKISAALKQ
jgi:hypothetical protein